MFCRNDLEELLQPQEGPCVSLYLPTNVKAGHPEKDPIRLKNLLKAAQQQLQANNLRSVEVKHLLAPAYELVEDVGFWRRPAEGAAIFLSRDRSRVFSGNHRFAENVVVDSSFYVVPLLVLLAENHEFYILALSQNQVRFFKNRGERVQELDLGATPRSLADAMVYEEPLKQLQVHSGAPRSAGGSGAVFHGQGTGTDDNKDRILRFLQQVDSGLDPHLKNQTFPMVVAGVDYLLPIFRKVSTYPHLLEEGLTGNPDEFSGEVLAERAKKILAPHFQKPARDALERFAAAVGTGRASSDSQEVLRAAILGRVETLLVAENSRQWAALDADSLDVELHDTRQPGDLELLNECATRTLALGGSVLVVPGRALPGEALCLALFRY